MQEITLGTNLSMSGTTLNASGGGGGTTINSTDTFLPRRTSSTTFADSGIASGAASGNSILVTPTTAGSNLGITTVSGNSNENLTISSKGTSAIGLNKTSSLGASVHVGNASNSQVGFRVDAGGGSSADVAQFTVGGNASAGAYVGIAKNGTLFHPRIGQTAPPGGTQNLDWSSGNTQQVTFGAGNATITFSNIPNSAILVIILIQDGTGSRTATWPSTLKWAGGSAPTLTTAASAKDVFHFVSDGTNLYELGRALDVK